MKKALSAVLLTALASSAFAAKVPAKATTEDSYPNRPITLISAFSVGGNADTAARLIAEYVPPLIGSPIAVFNRTGKNGIDGTMAVKKAAPNGYTLLLGRSSSNLVQPIMLPGKTPYRIDDFEVVGILEMNAWGCATANRETTPATFEALKEAIKTKPGSVTYSFSGAGAADFTKELLAAAGFARDAIKGEEAPGANDSVRAVLDGKATFVCANLQALIEPAKLQTVRLLFTNNVSRTADFPNVQTNSELGLRDLENLSAWSALFAPKGTPKAVLDQWGKALRSLAVDENWPNRVQMIGSTPSILVGDDANQFIQSQAVFYSARKK